VGNEELKRKFSRLFSLSVSKEALLDCYETWVNSGWEWDLVWRRIIFVWEKNQVNQLLEVVQGSMLDLEKVDKWASKDVTSLEFSVKFAYVALKGVMLL